MTLLAPPAQLSSGPAQPTGAVKRNHQISGDEAEWCHHGVVGCDGDDVDDDGDDAAAAAAAAVVAAATATDDDDDDDDDDEP